MQRRELEISVHLHNRSGMARKPVPPGVTNAESSKVILSGCTSPIVPAGDPIFCNKKGAPGYRWDCTNDLPVMRPTRPIERPIRIAISAQTEFGARSRSLQPGTVC